MSPEEMAPEEFERPVRNSGAVTAVAIVSFIVGGLNIICGLLVMFAGAFIGKLFGAAGGAVQAPKGLDPQQAKAFGQIMEGGGGVFATIFAFIGVCFMIFGVPTIIAGVGVMQRRQWGRILAIVLGILYGLWALVNLLGLPGTILTVLISAGYCVLVLVVLFNSQYAAEFK